ncbi:tyrosyl-DNA phosphodiesterase 1 [Cichlidogyrus casuarinus]|uniref:Tyrosyl-DNA phosphodiesterase 1 n=1 Tax=Cichlidogyrus casuarinus TaxID=1844966 RepID=A0ABD2QAY4_9PLAT
MMWLQFKDGVKIVIHTSNMIREDWTCRTQGLYISPEIKVVALKSASDSETQFRHHLLEYISHYGPKVVNKLQDWISLFKQCDFSPIRVALVASVPGRHTGTNKAKFGHLRMEGLLKSHLNKLDRTGWPVVGQFSSIGSLGPNPVHWLKKEWINSFSGRETTGLRLIYPTVENVRQSVEGYRAGGCLPYFSKVRMKQQWLETFLHKWEAGPMTRAIPHIKSYCCVDPESEKVAWFLLTSANLSKAAWGQLEKGGTQLFLRSYELGVLFLPKFCLSSQYDHFELKDAKSPSFFPVPYDLPPVPYRPNIDSPWIVDQCYDQVDAIGGVWKPR